MWMRRLMPVLNPSWLEPLRQFIDCPLVSAGTDHDNLRSLRAAWLVCVGTECEQGDGEGITSSLQLFSPRDFIRRIAPRREEELHAILGAILLCDIGQHKQTGFVVLVLPRLQKAIGRSERRRVFGVGSRKGRGTLLGRNGRRERRRQ